MNQRSRFFVLFQRLLTPTRVLILSFAGFILLGTVFLCLPSATGGRQLPFIDALFTATSGVCVTGLTVINIGKDLSVFGQLTTLVLFQVGGLGIITFSVMLFSIMGRGISFRDQEIIQSTFFHTPRRDFMKLIRTIFSITVLIESIGTVLLFIRFSRDFPPGKALYNAVYHSVSAFNNCGYSLFASSLMDYRQDAWVNLVVMALIVMGGIGFIVQYELIAKWRGRIRALSLHSKIVLRATLFLIIAGAVLFFLFEIHHVNKGGSLLSSAWTSLFQSVTARTCGFNTIPIGLLANSTLLLLMVLMFIGGAPGSTAGGIKVTSFSLIMLLIWNKIKDQDEVNVLRRTIPREVLTRTIAIVIASTLIIFIAFSFLLITHPGAGGSPAGSRHYFISYLFEAISAFGTVGLSMGITPELGGLQKIIIIVLMFIGRIGPITLAYSWYSRKSGLVYAEESVMVG
jgi:trk system potassium uptake protein TrkH